MGWPNRDQVEAALRRWVGQITQPPTSLQAVGYFGSYARNEAGVGSDLDLVIIVDHSDAPPYMRSHRWNLHHLPVPTEAIVYTQAEWQHLQQSQSRFAQTLATETIWVFPEGVDE
ncbi:nucleotidyltransferase domain-containing protein [Halomicronema hongdechloris]|nr:nucleotidyltransferase domain-containing protein [Halomicronema hongdechloris]